MKSKHGVRLKDIDIKLFKYLHAHKVATYEQILRDIYRNERKGTVVFRLNRFEKAGLINGIRSTETGYKKVISITKKCFKEFVSLDYENVIQLRSDSIAHDLKLVDLRHHITSCSTVVQYFTENVIQTWRKWFIEEDLRHFVEVRPDAVIKVRLRERDYFLPVEYDASAQYAARNRERLKRHYLYDDFPALLYICKNQRIMKQLLHCDRKYFSHEDPKIFYALLDQIEQNETLRFYDRDKRSISLGPKNKLDFTSDLPC